LARISAQIENFIIQPEDISKLNIVLKNVNQLSELVNSLLILSRIDFIEQAHQELVRVDEILYKCMDKAHSEYQNIEINFEILESNISEKMMLVKCNPSLLEIVFSNLIKNAYTYSTDKKVKIEMFFEYELMKINFINNGPTLSEKEKIYLYEPFMRGQNSKNTNGIGLGLRMVYRILNFYGFSVVYDNQSGFNEFALTFKHQ
jgi:K+-sensing histidine kinase KdpD